MFADVCVIYRGIMDSSVIDKLQKDLLILGKWEVENEMYINPGKSKTVRFTNATMKERISYYNRHQLISEINRFNYLGILIRSDLNWVDYVNYAPGIAWKMLHFVMHVNKN